MSEIDDTVNNLSDVLKSRGIEHDCVDGDILITQGYLSELLEFCRDWRSKIEELG